MLAATTARACPSLHTRAVARSARTARKMDNYTSHKPGHKVGGKRIGDLHVAQHRLTTPEADKITPVSQTHILDKVRQAMACGSTPLSHRVMVEGRMHPPLRHSLALSASLRLETSQHTQFPQHRILQPRPISHPILFPRYRFRPCFYLSRETDRDCATSFPAHPPRTSCAQKEHEHKGPPVHYPIKYQTKNPPKIQKSQHRIPNLIQQPAQRGEYHEAGI